MIRRAGSRGFTLIELILALGLVGLLLLTAFGGLRIGLAAWRQGEARAEAQQQARSLGHVLERSLAGAYPYLIRPPQGGAPVVLFEGEPDRVGFVTKEAPLASGAPVAFTAVSLAMVTEGRGQEAGLALRQMVLPNDDPFAATIAPLLVDPSVASLRFRYLGDDWQDRWEVSTRWPMPRAIEVTMTMRPAVTHRGGGPAADPAPLVVDFRMAPPPRP